MAELTVFGKLVVKAIHERAKRTKHRYTIFNLQADAGMTNPHLYRAVRGELGISATQIHKLCNALQCSPETRQALLNAAGYASQAQIDAAALSLQQNREGRSNEGDEGEEDDQETALLGVD